MAQLLAPYHNGMRLGQGFNSYTQQICLDNAVLIDNNQHRSRVREYYVPDDLHKATKLNMLPPLQEDNSHGLITTGSADEEKPKLQPWVKPQIVTYSSRFVDKLQDVTESMNVSGALSIQTATVGGKGSGSYIDSDKFKSSDINFHLQVKVTNQIHKPEEYTLFNKIHNLPDSDFTSVYGDCFISGFEEGGELNAIVSMKVTDKSKIYKIKAELQGSIKGGVQIDAKISGEIDKESTDKSTETTIAVNWAGGGSIKAPEDPWTIETMTKAAAAFPDLVAMTPQRTYAILTKYTALESFQRQTQHYSILDYENASIYTNMLMDHFMDYKVMWKQLSQATYELQRGTAHIDWAETSDEIGELATIRPLLDAELGKKLKQSQDWLPAPAAPPVKTQPKIEPKPHEGEQGAHGGAGEDKTKGDGEGGTSNGGNSGEEETEEGEREGKKSEEGKSVGEKSESGHSDSDYSIVSKPELPKRTQPTQPPEISQDTTKSVALQVASGAVLKLGLDGKPLQPARLQFRPFKPSLGGLIQARKVCRSEMAKIVNEVDLITKEPKLAIDTRRDELFLEPLVYKQLLPVVRTWSDDMLPDARLSEVPIILGYSAPSEGIRFLPNVVQWLSSDPSTDADLFKSMERVKRKSKNYRMVGLVGTSQTDLGRMPQPRRFRMFNDLEGLDPTYRPVLLAIWVGKGVVQGIQINYANGERKSHGDTNERNPCVWIQFETNDFGTETIFELQLTPAAVTLKNSASPPVETKETVIASIRLVTSMCKVLDTAKDPARPLPYAASEDLTAKKAASASDYTADDLDNTLNEKPDYFGPHILISRPDVGGWSLRGFFGFVKGSKENARFLALGSIFGRDRFVPRPPTTEFLPICKRYLTLTKDGMTSVGNVFTDKMKSFPGRVIMGEALTTPAALADTGVTWFNHGERMEVGWQIAAVQFATKDGKLKAIETTWTNGIVVVNGDMTDSTLKKWKCQVSPAVLLNAKITSVSTGTPAVTRIQTVEFVRSEDADGNLPSWLLDVATLRYFGDGATYPKNEETVVEAAPNHDAAVWSVRGFHGAKTIDGIVALGVIWGRDK